MAGQVAVCPVSPEAAVALASPATTIAGLIAVAEASREAFGGRTAINLPALSVTVREMLDALRSVGGDEALELVRFEHDATISRVVQAWPSRFPAVRAARLGLVADGDFRSIVLQYVRDHAAAVTNARALAAS